jgi:tetratricopeptide (TPR) repeat protein
MPRVRILRPSEKDPSEALKEGMPQTFARLADLLRLDGRYDEAESVCLEGLKEFPGYDSGHIVLALTYRDKGEIEKALIEFHAALKCEPENLLALKSIADIHWDAEEFSLARSYYRQVLQRDKYSAEARERVRRKPKPERPEDHGERQPAATENGSGLEGVKRDVFNTMTLARLYVRQGHIRLAKQVCEGILEKDPDDGRVRAFMDEIDAKAGSN